MCALAEKATEDGLPEAVAELLLASADLEDNEAHARALLFLIAVGKSFAGIIERAEEVERSGWN